MIHISNRWFCIEDHSPFRNINFENVVRFIHTYRHRRQQEGNVLLDTADERGAPHQITDEQLIDIERVRQRILKEIDRKATDFPRDRL